jgi:diadenosine tetraphosphatase ApaH/serine/threonine PP2A family protein phosphatase
VHGSPRKINEYVYEDRPEATFERLAESAGADVLLFGHTHLPYLRRVGTTLFVNAGSVGRPRDGDPRAGYVLLRLPPAGVVPSSPAASRRDEFQGDGRLQVEFRRVVYDVDAAARAVVRAGLPSAFADHLRAGGLERAAEGARP